jgi:hypothetical protein
MEHAFPDGTSDIEFAMARGKIDHRLSQIATDVARTVRFHMDFLHWSFARHLEGNTMRRLFAQGPHQGPAGQETPQGGRGGGAGTVETLRLLRNARGHCRNPVNMFSCNDSTSHGV